MAVTFAVVTFEVYIGCRMQPAGSPALDALITCSGSNLEQLTLLFCSPGSNIPINEAKISPVVGTISFPRESFSWCLDALRNEQCSAFVDPSEPQNNRIIFAAPAAWGHFDAVER